MAGAVRNVIFDLGGVVFDGNPDHIVSRVQPAGKWMRFSTRYATLWWRSRRPWN